MKPNLEQDFISIFMKSMKISSKLDILTSISQSWVDFEQIWNKFLDPFGLRVMPNQKYSKKCLAFRLLFDCNAAWTGILTKYSEFDLYETKNIFHTLGCEHSLSCPGPQSLQELLPHYPGECSVMANLCFCSLLQ